jgi:hypothetical protein
MGKPRLPGEEGSAKKGSPTVRRDGGQHPEVAVDRRSAMRSLRSAGSCGCTRCVGRAAGYGKPLSANTVSKVHVLLAAMLNAAVGDGLILFNPAKKKSAVNPPTASQVRAQKPEIITWNRDEFDDELFSLWRTIAIPACVAPRRWRFGGVI